MAISNLSNAGTAIDTNANFRLLEILFNLVIDHRGFRFVAERPEPDGYLG